MDMGDILAQWDDLKKKEKAAAREKPKAPQVSHKKANAGDVVKSPVTTPRPA